MPLCLSHSHFSFQELGAYNISKTALLGLTRTLALELAPRGIRVNCLIPGVIETAFSEVVRIWVEVLHSPAWLMAKA